MAIITAPLYYWKRHVRAAVELQANILMALGAGIVDRCLCHQSFDRELRHRIVAIAARQVVALMNRARPMIAGAACVAGKTSLRLRRYGRTGILRIADDEPLHLRLGGMFGSGSMARFAYGNGWIRAIGYVQTKGVQGVGEVVCFEPVA